MNFVKRTWAEISLDAIAHNFNEIKNKVNGNSKICCVIKADGYGHGAAELANIYDELGADFFAVSNIDEGIEIRQILCVIGCAALVSETAVEMRLWIAANEGRCW